MRPSKSNLVQPVLVASVVCAFLALVSGAAAGEDATPESGAGPRISRIDVDVTLDTERGVLEETVALTVSGDGIASLTFRVHERLNVERSSASAGLVDHVKAGEVLRVSLDPPLDGPRTLSFIVSGNPSGPGGSRIAREWALLSPEDLWYPSLPETRAPARVRIRVPESWAAVAPGRRRTSAEAGLWEWEASEPVRSLAVAAARGLELRDGEAMGVAVTLAYPAGFAGVEAALDALADPMAWLAAARAPYPFDGFNLALMPRSRDRIRASGMMVMPATSSPETRADGADALAGQWFGEIVAGDGPWMRSFAAWQALDYARDRAIPPPAEISRLRREYLAIRPSADVPIARAGPDAPAAVLRGKGSAAPDVIRSTIGPRRFAKAMRDLFAEPIARPLGLDELMTRLQAGTSRSLERVFRDWFERRGAPDLEAELRTFPASRGGWRVDVTITQKGDAYRLPLEIMLHAPGRRHRERIEIEGTTTLVFYVLDFRPVRIELDPDGEIFRRGMKGE